LRLASGGVEKQRAIKKTLSKRKERTYLYNLGETQQRVHSRPRDTSWK